jgi:hypothetical protein
MLWSLLVPFLPLAGASESNGASTNASSIVRLEVPGIHNAFKVAENIAVGE